MAWRESHARARLALQSFASGLRRHAQGGQGKGREGAQQRHQALKRAKHGAEKVMKRTELLCQGSNLVVSCCQLSLNRSQALQHGALHRQL